MPHAVRRPAARPARRAAAARAGPARRLRRRACGASRRTCRAEASTSTSVATIPADAARRRRLRGPRGRASSPVSASPPWSSRRVMGDDVEVTDRLPDGDRGRRRRRGDARWPGPTRGLLTAERTALNFASHLSGVATATSRWVAALEGTRAPGAGHPQDAAGLARAAEVRRALRRRRQPPVRPLRHGDGQGQPRGRGRWRGPGASRRSAPPTPTIPVEVEVTDLDQLRELLDAGCERILLDNMTDDEMAEAVARSPTAGRDPRGLRRPHPRAGARRRRDRRRLHLGRCADPLGEGLRPRDGPRPSMTLLCADIGNSPHRPRACSTTATCSTTGGWRPTSVVRPTSGRCCSRACCARATSPTGVDGIAVCATVPAVLHEWRDMLVRHYGTLPNVVVEPGVRTGVPVLMDNPREVGADRVVNALAAASLYDGPAIVVDFGTATTFDVVSPRGRVHRRRHLPGHRHLARGARPPRRPAAQGRAAPARAR